MERFGEKRTIWKFTNYWMINQLQWMWKDFVNKAQFENEKRWDCKLIAMYVERFVEQHTFWKFTNKSIAMKVERFGEKRTIWKFTNDWMVSQLQWWWKGLVNNTQFENSKIIGCMWKDLANKCKCHWTTVSVIETLSQILLHYYCYNTVTKNKNLCANSRAESAFNQLELFTVLSKQFLIDTQNACLGRQFDFFSISECFQYNIIGKHLNVFPSLMSGPPMHHVRHTRWQHQPHKSGNKVYPCKPFSFYLLSNKVRWTRYIDVKL